MSQLLQYDLLDRADGDVDEIYKDAWQMVDQARVEDVGEGYVKINEGIPTKALADQLDNHGMSWKSLVMSGAVSPSYAIGKYTEQLNNMTILSVLLAGFAIGFVVSPPDFGSQAEALTPHYRLPDIGVSILFALYLVAMLVSGISSFIATVIAMHSINSISNALPTKASTYYMTRHVFYVARRNIIKYMMRGITSMVLGLLCAIALHFDVFYGIPALIVAAPICIFFVRVNDDFMRKAEGHSSIADKLAQKDILFAAEKRACIKEGLLS